MSGLVQLKNLKEIKLEGRRCRKITSIWFLTIKKNLALTCHQKI